MNAYALIDYRGCGLIGGEGGSNEPNKLPTEQTHPAFGELSYCGSEPSIIQWVFARWAYT